MANLKVTIVIRTKEGNGKRNYRVANGKTDSPGSFYLSYYQGSTPRYIKAGDTYDEAELAQIRLERKLLAASQGFTVPDETTAQKSHRIAEVIAAYLADLRLSRRPERSVKSKKSELEEFARFAKKLYVEEIKRADLIAYRNSQLDAGKASVTVLNKLMSVTTWLKKNPVISITGLLKAEDWPKKPNTEPRPYADAELDAMMKAATPDERLLLRFFFGTRMREQEIAHAEVTDIKDTYLQVQAKPQHDWKPKTEAGERKIPLGKMDRISPPGATRIGGTRIQRPREGFRFSRDGKNNCGASSRSTSSTKESGRPPVADYVFGPAFKRIEGKDQTSNWEYAAPR